MNPFGVLELEVFGTLELVNSFIVGIMKGHKNDHPSQIEILFWSNKKMGDTLPYLIPNQISKCQVIRGFIM